MKRRTDWQQYLADVVYLGSDAHLNKVTMQLYGKRDGRLKMNTEQIRQVVEELKSEQN